MARTARAFGRSAVNKKLWRQPITVTEKRTSQIRRLHERGLTIAQIAARIDRSVEEVTEAYRRLGIAPNTETRRGP